MQFFLGFSVRFSDIITCGFSGLFFKNFLLNFLVFLACFCYSLCTFRLLTSGAVSVNKLARVISVVTPENEAFLVNQVQMLSQGSLEVLVRDIKHDKVSLRTQNAARLNIPETMQVSITVDQDVAEKLEELRKKGIDVNQELRLFFEQRKQEIEQEKDQIAHELATQDKPQTRYLPGRVQKVIQKEHGNICSRTGCNKQAVDIHHEKRWGVDPSNDPHYLSPPLRRAS